MDVSKKYDSPEWNKTEREVRDLFIGFLGRTQRYVEYLLREENHEVLMDALSRIAENFRIIGNRKRANQEREEGERRTREQKAIEENNVKLQKAIEKQEKLRRLQQDTQARREKQEARRREEQVRKEGIAEENRVKAQKRTEKEEALKKASQDAQAEKELRRIQKEKEREEAAQKKLLSKEERRRKREQERALKQGERQNTPKKLKQRSIKPEPNVSGPRVSKPRNKTIEKQQPFLVLSSGDENVIKKTIPQEKITELSDASTNVVVTEPEQSAENIFYDELHKAVFGNIKSVGTFFSVLNSHTKGDDFPRTQDGWLAWSVGGWGEFLDRLAIKCRSKSTGDENICAQIFLNTVIPNLRKDAGFLEREKYSIALEDRILKIGSVFDMYRAIGDAPVDLLNLIMMKIKSKGTKSAPVVKSRVQRPIVNHTVSAREGSHNAVSVIHQSARIIQGSRYTGSEVVPRPAHLDSKKDPIESILQKLKREFPQLQVQKSELIINGFGSVIVSSGIMGYRKNSIADALFQISKESKSDTVHIGEPANSDSVGTLWSTLRA